MPFLNRVDRTIWWLTISKAADRSSNISNEDLEAVLLFNGTPVVILGDFDIPDVKVSKYNYGCTILRKG